MYQTCKVNVLQFALSLYFPFTSAEAVQHANRFNISKNSINPPRFG